MATSDDIILTAFSVDHAARVTGLSKSRLTRWDKIGFFRPEYTNPEDRGNPYGRVYSFKDLVGLRTLAVLADDHHIPLKELAETHDFLVKEFETDKPWAEISLSVVKKTVVFDLDDQPRDRHGQFAGKHISLPTIAEEVAEKAKELRNRQKGLHGTTERHKYVAHNAVVLAGTRIPISSIKSFIHAGFTDEQILEEYPTLTKVDLQFVRNPPREVA